LPAIRGRISATTSPTEMILSPGLPFGPYDVIDLIGAGAMGEVYRARDPKLRRDIALKVLPAAFSSIPDRRGSFEREARLLASLNHPHIGAIDAFHEVDGISALALELVDGETLAARLRRGPLADAEALRYALQITEALAYAHRRGVVHRDVKPTNIVVTPQGAKLLDFGLAHLVASSAMVAADDGKAAAELGPAGTPFYMSPEQSIGLEVDQRSDIYSLGVVLCQMFTGFTPDTASGISTRTLIRGLLVQIASRPLRLVVERCLATDPDERWLHASDLHHALVVVSESAIDGPGTEHDNATTSLLHAGRPGGRPRALVRREALPIIMIVALGVAAAAFLGGMRAAKVSPAAYQQLTFRRGSVVAARFAGDNTIVYSATWDGKSTELWSMRPDNPESRSLGITNALVVSVSPLGEMAIVIGRRLATGGMLGRLPLDASAPREVLAGVYDADWAPDGQNLAVAHVVDGKSRLEFPIGTVLHESEGWIDGIRVSPDNESVAFIDHALLYEDRGSVWIVPRTGGRAHALSGPWASVSGLAWSANGNEVWFTAAEFGAATSLFAADLSGNVRVISRSANRMTIRDIDRSGRVLLTEGRYRLRISAVDAAGATERDLSWLDGSVLADLSPDGKTLLINEMGAGAGTPLHAVYLRKSDGSSAIRIGEGASPALSPDGQWVATLRLQSPPAIVLMPTGAGQPRTLDHGSLADYQTVAWFPDGRRLLIAGSEDHGPIRLWTLDVSGGSPKPIGAEGLRIAPFSRPISPDGTRAIVIDPRGAIWLHSLIDAGVPQPIPGLQPGDLPIRWDADGRSIYFFRKMELPSIVYRHDLADGRQTPVATLAPADAAGVSSLATVQTTPDGKLVVYSYAQTLSDLFLLGNVR
jgi:Tol biopolymer transport system component